MYAWESIQKAVDYIEEHLAEDTPMEELAGIASLSMFYFQRLFVRLVKKPVREYIKLRRLANASKALEDKKSRIIDIALKYGFNSHETFSRAFKDAYGFTPAQYRDNPVLLNNFNKPDLLLGYVMVDEGVPLISDGLVLEINRRILAEPLCFVGVKDYVRMDWHKPDGKVTGVDEPGATWARFHQVQHKIQGYPNGRNLGMSYGGDAPKGYFTYFAGKETVPQHSYDDFDSIQLPAGAYVVCGFEAENFEELVTNIIYKAGNFTGSWLKKHNIACGNYMPELYFPVKDVAYMEMWYPVVENTKLEDSK